MWNSSTVAHWCKTISIHRIHRATSSVCFIWRYLAILYLAAYVGVFGYRTLYIYMTVYIYTPTVEYVYIYTDMYLAYICIYSIQTDIASSTLETSCGAGFNRGGSSLKGCPSCAETVLMMIIFHILLLEEHIYWIIIIY